MTSPLPPSGLPPGPPGPPGPPAWAPEPPANKRLRIENPETETTTENDILKTENDILKTENDILTTENEIFKEQARKLTEEVKQMNFENNRQVEDYNQLV